MQATTQGPTPPSMDVVREVLKRYKGVNAQERKALSFLKAAASKSESNDVFTDAYEKQAAALDQYAKTLASQRNSATPPSAAETNALKLSYATLLFGKMAKYVAASDVWRHQQSTLTLEQKAQAVKLFGPLVNLAAGTEAGGTIAEPRMSLIRLVLKRYSGVNDPEKAALAYLTKIAAGAPSNKVFTDKYEAYAAALARQAATLAQTGGASKAAELQRLTGIAISQFGMMVKYIVATEQWRAERSKLDATGRELAVKLFGPLYKSSMASAAEAAAQRAEAQSHKSPEELIAQMKSRKVRIELLKKKIKGANPAVQAQLQSQLNEELLQTAALITAAKGKQLSATRFTPSETVPVDAAQQAVLTEQVQRQVAQLIASRDQKKAMMEQLPAGSTRNQLFTEVTALNTQILRAQARLEALAQGKDIVPSSTPVGAPPRPVLSLPANAQPSMDEQSAANMYASLKTLLPRQADETDEQYAARIKESMARALARFVVEQHAGATVPEATQKAVEQTVVQDAPVIAAEIKAGGVASDPAAQAMQPVAEAVVASVVAPDPAPVAATVAAAAPVIQAQLTEEIDELEDEDEGEEDVEESKTAWYAKLAAAGAAIGAAFLFLTKG